MKQKDARPGLSLSDDALAHAFDLAHWLIHDETASRRVVAAALAKLGSATQQQEDRLRRASSVRRNRVNADAAFLLSQLVLFESERHEIQKERSANRESLTEEDLVGRFTKHLVNSVFRLNSFHAVVAVARILHNYTTSETMALYDAISPSQSLKDDAHYRRAKLKLMDDLQTRFGAWTKVECGTRFEKRFASLAAPQKYSTIVKKILEVLAPPGAPAGPEYIDRLREKTDCELSDTDAERARFRAILDPTCFEKLTRALGLDPPDTRLTIPAFRALASGRSSAQADRGDDVARASKRPAASLAAKRWTAATDCDQAQVLRRGIHVWNHWRAQNLGIKPDLRGADLSGLDLSAGDFRDVDFTGADLRITKFVDADLRGANLADALVGKTVFGATDLSGAQGLDTCVHHGDSVIDHGTLRKSGRLPLPFLRGCGLPDQFIEYAAALTARPIEFYSCFISYSTKDEAFARRLHEDLQSKGVRCWFAPSDMKAGARVHEQIDEAIRLYDRLLLILSENSMTSPWVKTEISRARRKELNEGRRLLFPIGLVPFGTIREWKCFDADSGKDSAREIREYFIPDFSHWKDETSYKRTFSRLLRDLTAETGRHEVIREMVVDQEG